MATRFDEIYGYFLNQITDYELGELSKDDVQAVSEMYLLNSLMTIQDYSPKILDVDTNLKQFNEDLTMFEKLLVAKSMKLAWVQRQKNRQELMRKAHGDNDYKVVQGTSYLKTLSDVETQLTKEIRNDMIRHTWDKEDAYTRLRS